MLLMRFRFLVACVPGLFLGTVNVHGAEKSENDVVYRGEYVRIDRDGSVVFDRYPPPPPPTVTQYARQPLRTRGPMYLDGDRPYQYLDVPGLELPKDAQMVAAEADLESVITEVPFQLIDPSDLDAPPAMACGRLEVIFNIPGKKTSLKFYGSASALQTNLLITAAHNFVPELLDGVKNAGKVQAEMVSFEHQLIAGDKARSIHPSQVNTHCFIHPRWLDNFDQRFDVAFVFLSEPLDVEKIESLMKLHIEGTDVKIDLVGYPHGKPMMYRTTGETQGCADESPIFYHSANTHPGNSGSPITRDGNKLIGIHTRGQDPHTGLNSGVRVRQDIIDFMDSCTKKYQMWLTDAHTHVQEIEAEEEERKEALRQGRKTRR